MIKKIFKIIQKLIMAVLIIYGYNVVATPLHILIPINILTVILVSILGVPSMIGLILFYLIYF